MIDRDMLQIEIHNTIDEITDLKQYLLRLEEIENGEFNADNEYLRRKLANKDNNEGKTNPIRREENGKIFNRIF